MNFYSASTCRYKRAQVLPLLKKTATVMLFIASKLGRFPICQPCPRSLSDRDGSPAPPARFSQLQRIPRCMLGHSTYTETALLEVLDGLYTPLSFSMT